MTREPTLDDPYTEEDYRDLIRLIDILNGEDEFTHPETLEQMHQNQQQVVNEVNGLRDPVGTLLKLAANLSAGMAFVTRQSTSDLLDDLKKGIYLILEDGNGLLALEQQKANRKVKQLSEEKVEEFLRKLNDSEAPQASGSYNPGGYI